MHRLFKSVLSTFMAILLFTRMGMAAESPLIAINEIHYHPNTSLQAEEFIELYGGGEEIVDLSDWRFTNGIKYKFPPGTMMKPGDFLVIARDPEALKAATGFAKALGPFSGKMDNAGEKLTLADNAGNIIDELIYGDEGKWPEEADGSGPSLELVSPLLPNEYGVCWKPSSKAFGTPGAQNSVFAEDPPPIITKTRHDPPVPKPGENVTIASFVFDNSGSVKSVTLEYRKDGDPSYEQTPMYDDGQHGDGIAGDYIYGAGVAGLGDGERLDFRIKAVDAAGAESLAPSGAPIKTYLCPFSYHVPPADLPTYRIVMTRANRKELEARDLYSDELLDATFIRNDGKIYYNLGVRYRGGNSRKWQKKSYRLNFYKDDPLDEKGATKLTLMAVFPANQWLAYDLFRRTGVPAPEAQLVRVHLNDTNLEVYLRLEIVDEDFISRVFFNEDNGNLYRGMKQGELNYLGEAPEPYKEKYLKKTNADIDDWSDLIRLTDILTNAPDEEFAEKVESSADVDNWHRFFATHMVLNNWEGGIYNFSGDDYYLYFKPTDGKAVFIPWDMDTTLMGSQFTVWITKVPSSRRFLHHPAFTLPFLKRLRYILDHEFSKEIMFQKIDSLPRSAASDDYKKNLKKMVADRHTVINDEIQNNLSIDTINQYGLCQAFPRKSVWRYLRGTGEPSKGSLDWTRLDFDDSSWAKGPAIFGYGDADDTTDFPEMRNSFVSVYIRKEFYILNPEDFKNDRAILKVNYNDGYIAYLNGKEIARSNLGEPGTFVPCNISATDIHGAGLYETKELGSIATLVKPGRNVLAIQAHNADIADWTFSIDAYLYVADPAKEEGREWTISEPGGFFTFQGTANQWKTQRVEFNGHSANYSSLTGLWSYTHTLAPGQNAISLRALDEKGEAIETLSQTIIWDKDHLAAGGTLTRDTVWSADTGSIQVQSMVVVPEGISLTITQGTEIRFAPQTGIKIHGSLYLQGSPEKKIRLLPMNGEGFWGEISVEGDRAGLIVKNAELVGGKFSLTGKSWGYIENLLLKDLPKDTGIYANNASFLMMKGSRLENVSRGVHAIRTGIQMEDCFIKEQGTEGMLLELQDPPVPPEGYSPYTPNISWEKIPSSIFREKQGILAHDETWDAESGPYYIPESVIIPKGTRLTIEPGAVIFLHQGATIVVNGGLKAEGAEHEPIRFTGWRTTPWGGIIIEDAESPVLFRYCRFSHSSMETSAITLRASAAEIENSFFEHCSRYVEVETYATLNFKNNFVVDSIGTSQCVRATAGGTMTVDSCFFYNCWDPVEFSAESSGKSIVRNSIFIGGPDDGIDSNDCSPLIEGNIIAGFKDKGISLGLESSPVVTRNLIYDCGMGIGTKNKCRSSISHNTIVNNEVGIYGHIKTPDPDQEPAHAVVDSCIVWGNKIPLLPENGTVLQITNSDIDTTPVHSGEGNMNKDPKFTNAQAGDYRLGAGSPCIGSGKNKTDTGAFSLDSPPIPTPPPPPVIPCIIKHSTLEKGKGSGIVIRPGIRGIVTGCRLKGFGTSAIVISPDASVDVSSNINE